MRFSLPIIALLFSVACATADTKPKNTTVSPTKASPQGASTPDNSKDGEYFGKGKVTKINNDLGSVEMDHEDIQNLMPAMRMEFFVSDKALLKGLAIGDKIDFTLLYKGGTETITKIGKTK